MDNTDLTGPSPDIDVDSSAVADPRLQRQPSSHKHLDPAIVLANKGIEELNKIDEDISTLLLSASLAIKSLTTPTSLLSQSDPPPDPTSIPPPTLPSQLETFKSHASTFHNLLDSIRVNLRRQILLQDQAEILAPLPSNSATGATAANAAGSTGPGAGGFDIGLLNVRNDAVGKDMEAELWEKTRAFLDSMERAREAADAERQLLGGATNEPVETADGDIDMAR